MIRIYCRVSTDKQDLDMQDHSIREFLKDSYKSAVQYVDIGISGTTADRPSYQRLLKEVESGDVIVVYEFSRLWRDMQEQSRAIKDFLKSGVVVSSVTEGFLRNEEDRLSVDIKGVINQHEAQRIRRRSIEGVQALREKVAKGEAVWNARGSDKSPRKTAGYKARWEKYRADKASGGQ